MVVLVIVGVWLLLTVFVIALFRGAGLANRDEDKRRAVEEEHRRAHESEAGTQRPSGSRSGDSSRFAALDLPPAL